MAQVKSLALTILLAGSMPLLAMVPAQAETGAAASKAGFEKVAAAKTDDDGDAGTSDADKRAKAADCSKQADAKHLHGAARKKFRSACKRDK